MDSTLIFLLQVCLALLAGGLAAYYLKTALTGILVDLCGTVGRADFWWRTSAILLLGLPLLLVLFFAANPVFSDPALALRDAFRLSLIGVLVAVGLLSRRIWKHIPTPVALPQHATGVESNEEVTPCAS
ncbi:hypothetical protein [Azonexus sp. R2A61]|uniref:hypothetical protein n=1 Tax=Azonexus sp. R2A61 TaxID=2744443 RepID=UPI001F1BCAC4|nr:hypothetical protein [Azonexus sp. R2A61]